MVQKSAESIVDFKAKKVNLVHILTETPLECTINHFN